MFQLLQHLRDFFFWILCEKVEFNTGQSNNSARLYFPLKENVHCNTLSEIKADIYTKYRQCFC